MVSFAGKLKRLKNYLLLWNKEVFDNVQNNLKIAEEELNIAERELDANPSDSNSQRFREATSQYHTRLTQEECFFLRRQNKNG